MFLKILFILTIIAGISFGSAFAQPELGEDIGKSGKKDGQFKSVNDIVTDSKGNIYVSDAGNNRIQKFDSDGKFVLEFGEKGKKDGQLNRPRDVTVDNAGFIYVTDRLNHKIQKFDSQGNFVLSFGSRGVDDGEFNQPTGIALDSKGKLYVTDLKNHRYQVFSSSGKHFLSVGEKGSVDGKFNSPENITIDNKGNVYVSDTKNNRIQKFDLQGNYIFSFGDSNKNTGFKNPRGLTLGSNEKSLLIVDSGYDRIRILSEINYVPDRVAPIVSVPDDITMDATSSDGTISSFSVSAFDEIDGNVAVTCTPNSGSIFQEGLTEISCYAHDSADNLGSNTFLITVLEFVEPVVDEPVVDEPVVDEPVVDEPVVDEPVVDDSTRTLTKENSEITITDDSISKITVESDVDSNLDFSSLLTENQITTQTDLEIIIGEQTSDEVKIEFASQTIITGDGFTGGIDLPDGQLDSGCPINFEKDDEKIESCIEIGKKGQRFSLSKPVRIVLAGEGDHTPYTALNDNEDRAIITTQCSSDDVNTIGLQIGSTGQPEMCYLTIGKDMIIWTSHFTAFGTISTSIAQTTESTSSSSSSGDRPPPKIDGIGLFKIIDGDTETSVESQNFEKYFPYSMHSYITDSLNYGESNQFVKIGQFFELEGYSSEILPVIAKEGDNIQFQVRLYDKYKGVYIEHVSLYFTDKDSDKIEELDTFVSYERGDSIRIGDPQGIFDDVQVAISPEFDAYWVIFDVTFSKHIDTKNILIEAWHESQQPTYAKIVNAVELLNPLQVGLDKEQTLKIARVNIPSIHTSPVCADDNSCFDPYEVTILKDGIVTWVNEDSSFMHAITSGTAESGPNNKFNGFLRPGSTFEYQFSQTGIYPYYCAIHPWTSGLVNVIENDGSAVDTNLRDSTPGVNISGTLDLPEDIVYPLIAEIMDGGNYLLVEAGSTLTLETKNLSAEISGNVGNAIRGQQVTLTIIRPDGSQDTVNTLVNSDGEYFFPTRLADNWQSGDYNLIAEYNGMQIGNLPFKLKSSTEYEFGGLLPSPSALTLLTLEEYVNLNISKKQLDEKLKELEWSDTEIKNLKDRLRSVFYVDSPKKQTSDGILADDVSCNVGLISAIKSSNGNPLCVAPESAEKLLDRGLIN